MESEHLSLLIGSGLTTAITSMLGVPAVDMAPVDFGLEHQVAVNGRATAVAAASGRGSPNIEDQVRAALELIGGLRIMADPLAEEWENELTSRLREFAGKVMDAERQLRDGLTTGEGRSALTVVASFLGSFTSRAATRECLHVFTTNYDRMIEFAFDHSGT